MLVSGSLLLLLGAPALAQGTPPPAPAATASPASAAQRTIVGLVVGVDAATSSVTVAESVKTASTKAMTVVLRIDAQTKLLRGTRPATIGELKPNDHVVARYVDSKDGSRALSLRVADAAR